METTRLTGIWSHARVRKATYALFSAGLFTGFALLDVQQVAASPAGSCFSQGSLCVEFYDRAHLTVWDQTPYGTQGDERGGFDNDLDIRVVSLVEGTNILTVRIEEKNPDVPVLLFDPSNPDCWRDTSQSLHVMLCNVGADQLGNFHFKAILGYGDDRLKFYVEPSARDALSRIRTELRGGIGDDSIISDETADYVDLGPGNDYGDLGGLSPDNSTAHDVGRTGTGYDTLYCDASYQTATPTRDPFNPSSWSRDNAGCTLIGGSKSGDYSWLFGANTDDDILTGNASGYAYDPMGSNRLYCGNPGPTTNGTNGPSLNLGARDLLCIDVSGTATIEDLVTIVSMLSGASDSAPYPPSERTTNYDATVIDAVIRAVDVALVGPL